MLFTHNSHKKNPIKYSPGVLNILKLHDFSPKNVLHVYQKSKCRYFLSDDNYNNKRNDDFDAITSSCEITPASLDWERLVVARLLACPMR